MQKKLEHIKYGFELLTSRKNTPLEIVGKKMTELVNILMLDFSSIQDAYTGMFTLNLISTRNNILTVECNYEGLYIIQEVDDSFNMKREYQLDDINDTINLIKEILNK